MHALDLERIESDYDPKLLYADRKKALPAEPGGSGGFWRSRNGRLMVVLLLMVVVAAVVGGVWAKNSLDMMHHAYDSVTKAVSDTNPFLTPTPTSEVLTTGSITKSPTTSVQTILLGTNLATITLTQRGNT